MKDETTRAFAAYWRTAASDADIPGRWPTSGPAEWQGKQYVVLRNVNGVLAVYRVRTSGVLKRLTRWPREIEEN